MRKLLQKTGKMLLTAALLGVGTGAWAATTTKTSALTKSVDVCGIAHSYGGEKSIDITTLLVDKYGSNYSEVQMMFTLDEDFDATKVYSAAIKFYVISRTSHSGRSLQLYSLDDETFRIPSGSAWESSTENAKIYNSGGANASNFGLGKSTMLAQTTTNNLTTGAYNSFNITTFVQGLTSKTGGDAVYLGMLGTSSIDVLFGGIGHEYPAYLEITYTDATRHTYSIKAVDSENNELKTFASGIYFDGDAAPADVSWSKCIKIGDTWYNTDVTTFTQSISGNVDKKITYTADPTIVYFEEGESITHAKTTNANYSGGSCSDYRTGGKYNSTTISETGVYRVEMYVAEGYDRGRSFGVLTAETVEGKTTYTPLAYITQPGKAGLFNTSNFTVEAGTTLYTGHTSNTLGLDYLIIRKIAVPKTITAAGYATFSSTYALDFTDVTDLKAYIATDKSGENIKMQEVTGTVAAGTGLVLKSATGGAVSVNIPIVASGNYYNTTTDPKNYLFAINSNYDLNAATDGGTNYVLSVQDAKVVFAPIEGTAAPVTAGHAALWLPTDAQGRALSLSFDDETNGISTLSVEKQQNKAAYNLNGQRVANPTKGLYIIEGKKVIVK